MTDINRALGVDGAGVAHMTDAAGKEWAFCHLTQSQKAAIVAAAKRKAWRKIEEQKRDMTEDQYKALLVEKSDEMASDKFEWNFHGLSARLLDFMNDPEGGILFMHHALASKQPTVTEADVKALATHDRAKFMECLKAVLLLDPELDPT